MSFWGGTSENSSNTYQFFWNTINADEDAVVSIHATILDISESGNQPMTSSNERYVIVFNGEIYNYIELSKYIDKDFDLDKISDTRIILEFIQRKGVKSFLDLADGMWSFALYDRKKFELFLSRDI